MSRPKPSGRSYGRLTRHERNTVERMLDRNRSAREIAAELGRSPSTVTREVAAHRYVTAPRSRYGEPAPADLSGACPRLSAWPRCCNGCSHRRGYGCSRRPRVLYSARRAQEAADAEQLEAAERMLREGFTMNDMLDQMKAVKKMGGMKGILGMLPGGQRALNQMGGNLDEGIFDKNEAIIMSMTKEERLRPSIINGQRRARIAKGAGVTPTEVNSLMKQWGEMNKMMGRMRTMANQAQAGGKNPDGIDEALEIARNMIL